jgi:hypothetical protein
MKVLRCLAPQEETCRTGDRDEHCRDDGGRDLAAYGLAPFFHVSWPQTTIPLVSPQLRPRHQRATLTGNG